MIYNGKQINEILEDIEKKRHENLNADESDCEEKYEETTTTEELKDFNKDCNKWKKGGKKISNI